MNKLGALIKDCDETDSNIYNALQKLNNKIDNKKEEYKEVPRSPRKIIAFFNIKLLLRRQNTLSKKRLKKYYKPG